MKDSFEDIFQSLIKEKKPKNINVLSLDNKSLDYYHHFLTQKKKDISIIQLLPTFKNEQAITRYYNSIS